MLQKVLQPLFQESSQMTVPSVRHYRSSGTMP